MDPKKQAKRLVIKTNVRAGCGEDAPLPPSDNGGNNNLRSLRLHSILLRNGR